MPIELANEPSVVQLSVDVRMADTEVNVRFIDEDQASVTVRYDYYGEYRSTHYECSGKAAAAALRLVTSWSGEGSAEDVALAEQAQPSPEHWPASRWIP
jgi:hypothetical protein